MSQLFFVIRDQNYIESRLFDRENALVYEHFIILLIVVEIFALFEQLKTRFLF